MHVGDGNYNVRDGRSTHVPCYSCLMQYSEYTIG